LTAILTAEGLTYNYETSSGFVEALKGIDLSVFKGEHVAVIGSNGSGKSTLLKHFNALLVPKQGIVRVKGLDTHKNSNIARIRQICGMVFQNPDNQIVATTVEEDVAFGPENLALPSTEIKKRVIEAMETTDINFLAASPPHNLSGGQKQRVAIAGVLAMGSECLLLDEPTSLLDPRGKEDTMNLIKNLHKNAGITIMHITQSMEEAALADRIIVMNSGKVIYTGKPDEVLSKVEKMKEWHLEAPAMAVLAEKIREAGVNLPSGIIHMDELVESLCS